MLAAETGRLTVGIADAFELHLPSDVRSPKDDWNGRAVELEADRSSTTDKPTIRTEALRDAVHPKIVALDPWHDDG